MKFMKKVFILIVIVAAMCVALPAGAQLKFGIKGGLNITDMSFSSDVVNTSNRTGFFIVLRLSSRFPSSGWVLTRLRFMTSARLSSMILMMRIIMLSVVRKSSRRQ